MACVTHNGPVNPAQVIMALGASGCTVRSNEDGSFDVDVADATADQITAALASITFDSTITGVSG